MSTLIRTIHCWERRGKIGFKHSNAKDIEHTGRIEMTNMIYSISNLMDKRIGY
jgi:hypothetical protein